MTLLLEGYATADMMPKRGVFAEVFPCGTGDGYEGLCPELAGRGKHEECHEYGKEMRRRKGLQRRKVSPIARPREWIPRDVRRRVAKRCKYKCIYCGRSVHQVKCVVDHVVPLEKGGSNDESNLTLACQDCNREKSTEIWQAGCKQKK